MNKRYYNTFKQLMYKQIIKEEEIKDKIKQGQEPSKKDIAEMIYIDKLNLNKRRF